MGAPLDLRWRRFGRLVAIAQAGRDPRGGVLWLCFCDCGNSSVCLAANLRKGNSTSCGCKTREGKHLHARGGVGTPTYQTWLHMRQRCLNTGDDAFENYGGRGVTICPEWSDFSVFLCDMGPRPEGKTIDRIDNSAGYSKDNCRWASSKQQLRNKRNNHLVFWANREMTLAEAIEGSGLTHQVVTSRLRLGWSLDAAINTPVRQKR